MTKDEAIGKLSNIKFYLTAGNPIWDTDTIQEAIDMAIDALENYDTVSDALNGYAELYRKLKEKYDNLKEKRKGYWIESTTKMTFMCSECDRGFYGALNFDYCPHCGARMGDQ